MIRTGKYELVVKYENGVVDTHVFETMENADMAQACIEKVCGDQLIWACVRPQLVK